MSEVTHHYLHFVDAEARHREVKYLVQDHTESKTRAEVKNAGTLVSEVALLTIIFYYILLLLDVKRKQIDYWHRVSIKKLPKNHKLRDLRQSYT